MGEGHLCVQPEEPRRLSYSRITYTNFPSFCMTTFRASVTNLTALLPQSRDCSCYVSRRILAPPQLWLQKHTGLRAHEFAHCAELWHQPRLANFACPCSWRLCGIDPCITKDTHDRIHSAAWTSTVIVASVALLSRIDFPVSISIITSRETVGTGQCD
jgi:hypothetical protein